MYKESEKFAEHCCLQSFNKKNSCKTFTLWHLLIAPAFKDAQAIMTLKTCFIFKQTIYQCVMDHTL